VTPKELLKKIDTMEGVGMIVSFTGEKECCVKATEESLAWFKKELIAMFRALRKQVGKANEKSVMSGGGLITLDLPTRETLNEYEVKK